MKELTAIESAVLGLIPSGATRKITIAEMAILAGIATRDVYDVINSLRKKGVPVCASRSGSPDQRGYFIATTDRERIDGLASYKAQVADMSDLISTIEQINVLTWQTHIRWPEKSVSGDGE